MVDTQPLLELESVKSQMGLNDDGQDDQILPLLESANRRLSLVLFPVLDITELESTPFFQDAKNVAFIYFRALYEQRVNNLEEKYKSYKAEYDDSVKVLLNAIKAQPIKDVSERSVLGYGGARRRHPLLDSNYGVTDSRGNYLRRGQF